MSFFQLFQYRLGSGLGIIGDFSSGQLLHAAAKMSLWLSYIAMCISMDRTTPLVDTYREIHVTLVSLKVYKKVPKKRAHFIFRQ